VISTGHGVRVFAHRKPVDMRKHFDALWGLVTQEMGHDVMSGDRFCFINRTRLRAKVLWWDGTGLNVHAKRLDVGKFIAPWQHPGEGPLVLTLNELALLLEGSELVGRYKLSPEPWRRGEASP
jgi:transposase